MCTYTDVCIYIYIYMYIFIYCSFSFISSFETRGVFTFTTGVCFGGGRGDPPETLNGLICNPLSPTR